jgi:hypothetical protein
MLKSLGVPARDAQTILGPSDVAVTLSGYRKVFDTEIATVLGRINDAFGGDLPGGTANVELADAARRRPLSRGP